ncbi:MAG TPA: hypothetical protein VFZ63_10810 [Jiangellaceae bacterium]
MTRAFRITHSADPNRFLFRHRMRTMLVLLALAAGGVILSACGGGGTAPAAETTEAAPTADLPETTPTAELTPSAELPADWEPASGAGYQIGIPPGWLDAGRALDDEEFMEELAGELGDVVEDEDLSALVEEIIRDDALDMVAVRIADLAADFAANFNIIVQPRGPLDEPKVILELAEDLVSSFGGKFTQAEEVTIGNLPSVEVRYDLPLPSGAVAMGIQDYVFADDVIYIATYTAIEPDLDLWASVLDTFTPTD